MADPKYANLPGIDTESKDVYESGDLPEEDQHAAVEELNSTSVELVSSEGAFEKFSGKYVSGFGKDFSGRIQSSKVTGYDANQGGLAALGEKETVLQKFNRLKIEVADLVQEVKGISDSTKTGNSPADLVNQIESLQMQLADSSIANLNKEPVEATANVEKLMAQLKLPSEKTAKITGGQKSDGTGTYQLYLKPDQAQQKKLQVAELEQRLARLEKVLGSGTDKLNILVSHSKDKTLKEAVREIETKLSLFDSEQLPQVDSRLQAILNKVNEINKAHKGSGDQASEVNQKISELYDLSRQWEGVRAALPQLIERLRALDTLHAKASDFSSTLTHLENMQTQITSRLHTSNSTQKDLEEMFSNNIATIEANITQLNKRMADLKK
ncbi:dynactin subunit 2-like [Clavelina lepadiformis]